jgi:hypothetical protein
MLQYYDFSSLSRKRTIIHSATEFFRARSDLVACGAGLVPGWDRQSTIGALMTRDEQFAYIETAKGNVLAWAKKQGIPLVRVEYVFPFVDTNFGLSAWFFYETDDQLQRSEAMGWPDRLVSRLTEVLEGLGYPAGWLSKISGYFDSHENVVRNYEGSYFYRLR